MRGMRYASKQADVCTGVRFQKLSLTGAAELMIILITPSTIDSSCLNLMVRTYFDRFRLNMDTPAISSVLEVMNGPTLLKVFVSTTVSTLSTDFSVHGHSTDGHLTASLHPRVFTGALHENNSLDSPQNGRSRSGRHIFH